MRKRAVNGSPLSLRSQPSSALPHRSFGAGNDSVLFCNGGWNPLAAEEVDAGADSVCGFNGGFARFCFAAVGIEHSANQPSVNHRLCPFLSSVF